MFGNSFAALDGGQVEGEEVDVDVGATAASLMTVAFSEKASA
jgi:hypothetical protein